MKEFLKATYGLLRFFLISIPVFLMVCLIAMILVIIKQSYKKLKLSNK